MAGIYIHIPFCRKACSYCDFHFSTTLKHKNLVIEAIQKELVLRKEELKEDQVVSIYFGGGTPSLLTVEQINQFIKLISANYNLTKDPEITLEANPDDLTEDYLIQLKSKTEINRLSIGVQSFVQRDLELMNRAHNADQAHLALKKAAKLFELFTLDLIYGVPGLTNEQWRANIKQALSYNPKHISSYALTVSPKTVLEHDIKTGKKKPLDEQLAQEQFFILIEELEKAGFEHYEISNFAKDGYYAVNNTAYWKGEKYLGVGPSAHSFNGKERSWNVANNAKYQKAIEQNILPSEVECLSLNDRYNEYVMTGLRTVWGISIEEVRSKFGESLASYLTQEIKSKLNKSLEEFNNRIRIKKSHRFYADGIAADLFYVD